MPGARPAKSEDVNTPRSGIVKPTPSDLMEDTGSGLDFGTRPDRMLGDITPVDRFFVRSHAPTPVIDATTWELRIDGDGVRREVSYSYDDLCTGFPLTTVTRTLECAGNRRVLFGAELGRTFEGTQWGRGAISTAEWTGVRLRDLLDPAGITANACDVMPESLDAIRARRPLPLAKASADDTIVAIAMNGESLPPDHGFPARLIVSGWLGAASIKWLGRIEVSEHALQVPWNTVDYVLLDPEHAEDPDARGEPITSVALSSLVELPWPARLHTGNHVIRGRAYAGENRVSDVQYRLDDEPWRTATITSASSPGVWARWEFNWTPEPGDHLLRVRAIDDRGYVQPESTLGNALGYQHGSVLAHPLHVEAAGN